MSITLIEKLLNTAKAPTTVGRDGGTSHCSDRLEGLILKGEIAMPGTINSLYDAETRLAERELSAFITAVAELFGPEQAKLSVEDWLVEFELEDRSPRSVTVAASARMANRLNTPRQMLSVTLIDTKVSPTQTSNLFASAIFCCVTHIPRGVQSRR
jgi:hypothetical protein